MISAGGADHPREERGGKSGAIAARAAVLLLCCPSAAGARPASLRTGFSDRDAYQVKGGAERATAFAHTRDARASIVRLLLDWSAIAPTRPPTREAARSPAWPGYDWTGVDSVVRDATAAGLDVLLSFTGAPGWAEGAGRPPVSASAPAGTWRPMPAPYRDFAEAAARRYSGAYADPASPGGPLPRVRYWQGWNEPNLTNFLTPQWRRRGGRFLPSSPATYRGLINAFYLGVKAVDASNYVVSAGTAPFGDPTPGRRRMPPALFTREFLCVRGASSPRPVRCPGGPARFDALAHHPYPIGPPRRHAVNPDDVVIPDLRRLTRPLSVALRAGNVAPRRPKGLWATEISWDSRPPDPDGIPARLHARYLAGALNVLWSQGVDVVAWWQLRDSAKGRGFQYSLQSGIYQRGATVAEDRPKPAFQAFRFPFTAYRKAGVARLWGLAPSAGPVLIERRGHGGWDAVARLNAREDRLFLGRLKARHGTLLRARQGKETSRTWEVF
jgi:hypothetical protein